tara:strand:- start:1443 stop:1835 length:393 start_codon:yes stop_codon:yes gene_type:complete
MPKTDIFIEDYTPKSFVVLGNTKIYKEDIKRLGGKFNQNLSGNRVGWIFPISLKEQVSNWISRDEKIPEKQSSLEITLQKMLKNQELILKNQDLILKKLSSNFPIRHTPVETDSDSEETTTRIPRLLKRN